MVRSVEITSITELTPRVKQFVLEAEEPFEYDPGQHTHLHVDPADLPAEARSDGGSDGDEDDGEEENGGGDGDEDDGEGEDGEDEIVRPYTPTSLPGTNRITLAIKRYDEGTASVYMHEREQGDVVEIEDPDGNLYLRDADEDAVFVSSGTGITPMVAMLRQCLREGTGEAYFFFGEKTQEDLIYRETLDQFDAEHDDLTVVYSLSEEDWDGPTGHVQEHVDSYVDGFDEGHFYACGVPGMVVETEEYLEERGVDGDRLFTEGWESDAVDE